MNLNRCDTTKVQENLLFEQIDEYAQIIADLGNFILKNVLTIILKN